MTPAQIADQLRQQLSQIETLNDSELRYEIELLLEVLERLLRISPAPNGGIDDAADQATEEPANHGEAVTGEEVSNTE